MKENGRHTVGSRGLGRVELLESSCDFFAGEGFGELGIHLRYTHVGMALVISWIPLGEIVV